MDKYLRDLRELNDSDYEDPEITGLYMGTVLANNDPQQMGRVRVLIHGIDEPGLDINKYRWVPIIMGISGIQIDAKMGPNNDISSGFTSYGSFGVPKIGAIVVIMFLGGMICNPVIMGFLPPNDMITGLPASNRGQNELGESAAADVTKLKANIDIAFGTADSDVKDTRGYEVTARAPGQRGGVPDVVDADRKTGDIAGDRSKFGYPKAINSTIHDGEHDNEPTMYSFTTPGQHSILMNDDPDNSRVRVRTLAGNQVILDDTNERIYISTGEGNSYIEMDMDGHIDIYSSNRISIHGENDINIKSDMQVNIEGVEGINLKSTKDIKIETDTSTNIKSGVSTYMSAGTDTNIKSGGNNNVESGGDSSVKAGGNAVLDSGGNIGLKAGGNLVGKGSQVHFNGPPPAAAGKATDAISANPVNREPTHEVDDWRAINEKGKRSDAVNSAHNDQSTEDPYENATEGGITSRKRLENWRK